MPGKRQTPTVRLRRLAAELRSLRDTSGLTRETVIERTGINAATLYRIEHGRVRPQTRTLRTLLDLYGVDQEQQAELVALLRDARLRGWLHAYQSELPEHYTTYIGFEGEAHSVWDYESLFVPGLLQTEDYARAVIRGGLPNASRDEVERRVEVRMERQALLHNENPLNLWSIVRRSCAQASGWRSGSHAGPVPVPHRGIRAPARYVPGDSVRCWRAPGHAGLVHPLAVRRCGHPRRHLR